MAQDKGVTPSGSGCQPSASAAVPASSQSGIPDAALPELIEWLGGHVASEPMALACLHESARQFECFTGRSLDALAAQFWDLPESVRHGFLRLAAYRYRELVASLPPPAAVAALWRPWRRLRGFGQ